MGADFEELDFQETELGELILRRRRMPQFGALDIYEIKLGDAYLMSSLFHEAEVQLAKLGLAALDRGELDVAVGGLGLGYTAAAALEDRRVSSLVVIEYLQGVIDWHEKGLAPLGPGLCGDARCRFERADFFARARQDSEGLDSHSRGGKFDAILLDIDHTPTHVLRRSNAEFYGASGLTALQRHLKPGGVFAMWADGEPEADYLELLEQVFAQAAAHAVEFDNPFQGGTSTGAVYVAKRD